MSDRIAVMSEGVVVQVGRPTDVYEHPRNRFVSEFLGTANIFAGTVRAETGTDEWSVSLAVQPGAVGPVRQAGLAAGQPVTLAVRPERVAIGPVTPGCVRAVLLDVVFRGAYFAYELRVEGQETPVFAYAQQRQAIPGDGAVGLTWAPDSPTVLEEPA